jgi:hypothetical protein
LRLLLPAPWPWASRQKRSNHPATHYPAGFRTARRQTPTLSPCPSIAINPDDPLDQATENGLWYDDAGDGPVHAVIIFDDKSTAAVQPAWYVTGDPGYAPQTRNIVSIWDDVYDLWVRELALNPALFSGGKFQSAYKPSFPDDIQPIFHGAMLQRWNTNLPSVAINNHDMIGAIKSTDDPTSKIPNLKTLIRDPGSDADKKTGAPMMPLSLGDAETSFLTVSATQYFLLGQWHAKVYAQGPGPALGPGENLDRITLENRLGGRYSPGIELSFTVRDANLYIRDWQQQDCGPFRINEGSPRLQQGDQEQAIPQLRLHSAAAPSGRAG